MTLSLNKADSIGILSSALCLIHCLTTPLLFVVQTQFLNIEGHKPLWWSSLDIIFLLISAVAIYKSSTSVTKKWIKIMLWISWFMLFFVIINEKIEWLKIPESAIYIPSISLIFSHWYGGMFCQCKKEECCINSVK